MMKVTNCNVSLWKKGKWTNRHNQNITLNSSLTFNNMSNKEILKYLKYNHVSASQYNYVWAITNESKIIR